MAQLFDPSVMNIYANQGNQMMQGLFQNKQREYSQAHDLDRMNLQNQFQIDSEGRTWDRTKPYMDEQQEIMRKWMAMYEKMLGGQARPAVPSSAGQNTWPTAAGGGYGGTTTGGGYGAWTDAGDGGGSTPRITGGGYDASGDDVMKRDRRRRNMGRIINYLNQLKRAGIASDLGFSGDISDISDIVDNRQRWEAVTDFLRRNLGRIGKSFMLGSNLDMW